MKIFKEYEFDIKKEKVLFENVITYIDSTLKKYKLSYKDIVFLIEFNIFGRNYERNVAENFQQVYKKVEKDFPEMLPYYSVMDHNLLNFYSEEYVQDERYQTDFRPFLTNLINWELPSRFLEKEIFINVLKRISNHKMFERIQLGFHGINWFGESNDNYYHDCNGNRILKEYISDMIIVEYGIGADFWSLVTQINITDEDTGGIRDIKQLEKQLVYEFGTYDKKEIKNAFPKEELQEQRDKEQKMEEKIEHLRIEMEQLELPHKMVNNITFPPKVNIGKLWKKVFGDSNYKWLGKQKYGIYCAAKESINGYHYDIEIELGPNDWRQLNYQLRIKGDCFVCFPIYSTGLMPRNEGDYEKYLENFRVQVEFVEQQMEDFLFDLFGKTPEWYFGK